MFSAFLNCFRVPELRTRIFFTLGMIFIARVGANLPLPGIDIGPLQDYYQSLATSSTGNLVGLYNLFTGGALLNGAVFALGIMPYISASIILQLMGAVVPSLARMQQEGEIGRQKITQYTRYLTIAIALIQALLLSMALVNYPDKLFQGYNMAEWGQLYIINKTLFIFSSTIILTAGTVLLMWIGEQITQRGIGNGISLLITVGILASMPSAFSYAYRMVTAKVGAEAQLPWYQAILLVAFLLIVIAAIVAMTQAVRKIPVQYAKRVVGRRVFGGQQSYLPLKVNYAGVMPVIFASAILMFPSMLLGSLASWTDMQFFADFASWLSPEHWFYYFANAVLILGFSYFWVSIMFKPIQIADDLKKNGGYIPGVRPGEPTAKFLDFVMTRLTLAGAIFLTIIAILPTVITVSLHIPFQLSQFFGGTSMLIAVGVTLDTMRQVETFLLQRHYDGFLKKGKARHRAQSRSRQIMDAGDFRGLEIGWLWVICGILFVIGLICWGINNYVMAA